MSTSSREAPPPAQPTAVDEAPWYLPVGDEVEIFLTAWEARLPVLLKGPTGCGKTRFVESMVHRLFRGERATELRREIAEPLVTVSCHEDLSATDLVGRYLLTGSETVWIDGPLTRSVRNGGVAYLDEIVEARKDTTVLIHSLTDYRRVLPVEKLGETLSAHADFLLVMSYNPGYQSAAKDLKPSTRQRFVAIDFHYPERDVEARIIEHESGCEADVAHDLADLGVHVRNLHTQGFQEGVSTRLLVYAGRLVAGGIGPRRACQVAVASAVTDDPDVQRAIDEVVTTLIPGD